ncbi:hypothetical protein [Aquimarina algiphila]|uniref:hypothetical protein n=1 Tax=Aquimarina algiphila TaxID=2047982 RepID=UPI00232D3B22|nr:hypothetical protein [Aquimarina algiphila]
MTTEPNTILEKELKNIHFDVLEWKSSLCFIKDEILFINQLLNSYVFEPTTPNLFERLHEFRLEIEKIELILEEFNDQIKKHENQLGGMMECDTISCDHFYNKNHESLRDKLRDFYKNFRKLKSEVFSYAGGILRKNKK